MTIVEYVKLAASILAFILAAISIWRGIEIITANARKDLKDKAITALDAANKILDNQKDIVLKRIELKSQRLDNGNTQTSNTSDQEGDDNSGETSIYDGVAKIIEQITKLLAADFGPGAFLCLFGLVLGIGGYFLLIPN
jgi:hypothetical protein